MRPQVLFRGEEIVTTGDEDLLIQGLYVGQKTQLPVRQGPVLSKAFKKNPLSSGILMDTCQVGLNITFQIQNPTAATLTWAATINGRAVL